MGAPVTKPRRPRVRPFSTGTQYLDWTLSNCEDCAKSGRCVLERALSDACIRDGTIAHSIAERMGYFAHNGADGFSYVWPCGEGRARKGR